MQIKSAAILIFGIGHALYLLVAILPASFRPVVLPHPVSKLYQTLTGSRQQWGMFETIPIFHDLQVYITITNADGYERRVGPLLPGFQPYPRPEKVRTYNLFDQMLAVNPGAPFLGGYLRNVQEQLRDREILAADETWHLELEQHFIRHLVHVRRDGQLSLKKVSRFGPDSPGGDAWP